MQLDCEAARDLIDGYAIGALDGDEARALESHVAGCDECARLVREASETGPLAMALSAPLVSSSPALKARVMASAAVLAEPRRSRGAPRWWQAAAAVLAISVAGALAWGIVMQQRVGEVEDRNATLRVDATEQAGELTTVRNELERMNAFNAQMASTLTTQDAIIDVVTQPDARRTAMVGTAAAPQASGRYLWSPGQEVGALIASGLPPLAPGQTYEMWVVYPSGWVSGGRFSVDASGAGRLVVRPQEQGTTGEAPSWFCVTLETAGSTERGPMVLRSAGE